MFCSVVFEGTHADGAENQLPLFWCGEKVSAYVQSAIQGLEACKKQRDSKAYGLSRLDYAVTMSDYTVTIRHTISL